jgi:hypothetical protein
MTTFTKLATGQSAAELIARAQSIEPRREDGGPFTLAVATVNGSQMLIVRNASGRAIGASDILSAEGVRAAAKRLIREHQQRAKLIAAGVCSIG